MSLSVTKELPKPRARTRSAVGVFRIKGRGTWRVRWRDPGSGKLTTKTFAKKAEAEAWAEGRRWEEREWGKASITQAERALITRLREACHKGGQSLEALLPRLLEVAGRPRLAEMGAREALEAFLEEGRARNLRPLTVRGYDQVCRDFLDRTGLVDLGRVDRALLTDFIVRRWSAEASRRHGRTHLLAWLRWCAAKGWASAAALTGISWPAAKSDSRRIPSLSPAEARALLGALPEVLRAACALGLFAGIRPEELSRLQWEDVHPGRRLIQITGAVAKIREARTLDALPGNLWAWIAAHPLPLTGPVLPITMRHWLANLRRARARAGITTQGSDLLRKTFASMAFHLPGGPTAAAEIMGHLRGLQVYLRHYRAVRSPEESREFFAIMPTTGK